MLFNSWEFAIFFAITYAVYVVLPLRPQNVLLLVASYVFYAFWDWRFLTLIIGSTTVDYFCALALGRIEDEHRRRQVLLVSMVTNLGLLGVFKYFNFFAEGLQDLASHAGWQFDVVTLQIVLPVGISFYTFQTMSYTIDVYRREITPTRDALTFAVFVAFFPQLVAGPIERAARLLPQLERRRQLTERQFYEGAWLIFFGLFKKVFVADNLAPIVDRTFATGRTPRGAEVVVALYAFAFQIYADFSGYSDMARGLAKLMGVELTLNFRMPYFAQNIREFWHRWHISLSTWLRDYVYISLGGGRAGRVVTHRNLLATMAIGGLWHGAAWTFVIWGVYQGLLLVAHRVIAPVTTTVRRGLGRWHLAWSLASMALTFHCVCLGWLFFRSESLAQAGNLLRAIVWDFGELAPAKPAVIRLGFIIAVLVGIQIYKERTGDMYAVGRLPAMARGTVYFVMALLIAVAGADGGRAFIYFQF